MIGRTLTVTDGRDTIGRIVEKGHRRFAAVTVDGKTVGIFGTAAEAAQALPSPKAEAVR